MIIWRDIFQRIRFKNCIQLINAYIQKHNNKGVYVKKLFVKLRIPKVKAYPTKDLFFTMLCFDSTLHHTTLKYEIPLQTRYVRSSPNQKPKDYSSLTAFGVIVRVLLSNILLIPYNIGLIYDSHGYRDTTPELPMVLLIFGTVDHYPGLINARLFILIHSLQMDSGFRLSL